jgi:transmembrane sensor
MAETHRHRFEQDQLRREAGEWFVIMNDENVSPDDEKKFRRWLARGALHRATYNRIASLHSAGKRVDWENLPPPKPVRGTAKRVWIAAIGFVALVGFVAWRMSGVPAFWPDATQIAKSQSDASLQYATAPGEIRKFLLPDGSRLTLDSDTSVRAWFRLTDRRLRLARGRARFDVAHEHRPFIVDAGDREIVAVGTVFDVAYRDDRTVVVHLLRGAIDVRRTDGPKKAAAVRLEPGDELRYAVKGADNPATVRKREDETDWTKAEPAWTEARVSDLIAAANRRSETQIVLEDRAIEQRVTSGLKEIDDPEMLAENLAQLYGLRLTRNGNRIILSKSQH